MITLSNTMHSRLTFLDERHDRTAHPGVLPPHLPGLLAAGPVSGHHNPPGHTAD
jgi:hypothetical protein